MGKTFFVTSLLIGAALAASSANAAGDPASGQQKAAACAACHGADGNSMVGMWPKLAGQSSEYLVKQLHDFKAGRRNNDQMSPMAAPLSEQDIQDLAAYFSTQKPSPAAGQADLIARGEKLYLKGTGRNASLVTACVGCHNLYGEGHRDWNNFYATEPVMLAPVVGSQHPDYVATQLRAYKDGSRSNDRAAIMRNIAARMDDGDIDAVSAYIATLKP